MISVTILTKNSPLYLRDVLQALESFDEVVVLDTGSTDDTMEIAKQFPNVSLYQLPGPFPGFGPAHNHASSLAKYDWILSIDSDEIVTPELVQEVFSLTLDEACVYSFPRHNYYNGKWIQWCGWYPDRQFRLYNRSQTRFTDAQVHEAVITDGMQIVALRSPMNHFSYRTLADFLVKMQSYSDLFALQYKGKRNSSLCKAILHGTGAFLKSYLIKKGFFGGKEGFIISAYNGHTAFYKYLKLDEANREN